MDPTLSLGISLSSLPCLRNTAPLNYKKFWKPAVYWGFMPTPLFVMTAVVEGFTLN